MIASDLLAHIRHTLGGPSNDALGGDMALVNAAGRHAVSMYPWSFMGRASATLNIVGLQNYVALPVDFGNLDAINATNSLYRRIRMTSVSEILGLRTSLVSVGAWTYIGAISWADSTQPRLEIWPTPDVSQTAALTIFYKARWVDLVGDKDAVLIPTFMEPLLIQLVRAFARGYEMEDQGSMGERLQEIENGPIMAAAIRFDGSAQYNLGPMRGSAVPYEIQESTWGWDSYPAVPP